MTRTAIAAPRVSSGSWPSFVAPLLAAALLASCASTVKVERDESRPARKAIESARLLGKVATLPVSAVAAFAESGASLLERARLLEAKGDGVDAAAAYLEAALEARELIVSGKEPAGSEAERALVAVHNAALARFAELWIADPRRLDPAPYRLAGEKREIEIAMSPGSDYGRDYFDRFVAAETVKARGMVSKTREGYGAPVVGIREHRPERAEEMRFYSRRGLHVPATLTMDEVGRTADGRVKVSFSLRNPLLVETVPVGRRALPLAADYSASLALVLQGHNEAAWGLEGFFRADERLKSSGIYLTEPYDPGRIPVLLIHGLISVPIIWRDLIPEMISEPDLSSRYQFMVFSYPSSLPIVDSAKLLRDQIEALRQHYDPGGRHPLSRDIVVAGHSMGGMLTHSLVADFGERLWSQFSDTPLDSLPLEPERREEIRQLLYFDPDPGVWRAIYFSAPHRGAKMAQIGLAGFIASTVRLPGAMLSASCGLLDQRRSQDLGLKVPISKKVTSVHSLRPDAPIVLAMDESPYKPGVVYHSIIGDRGRGDTPNSSDGVVEYWSSHQEGAASELIVPTGHGSYKHPAAVAEFKRILREHLRTRR
jgi:pimeloyl-ACP methyl ester carboxylesterase